MTHRAPITISTTDLTPTRLRKLMLRLAQLAPGSVYTITLFVADEQSEPTWTVMHLGKLENFGGSRKNVLE